MHDQLGRDMRGVVSIAARCVCGAPAVVRTRPRLEDGTPFPTSLYLTLPSMVAAVSRVEATGRMAELTADLADDEDLAAAYRAAHERYIARREQLGTTPEIDGISAGGMPTRVKCLHALVGQALAEGPGVNPVADRVLGELRDQGIASLGVCRCENPADEPRAAGSIDTDRRAAGPTPEEGA
ncbi:DUF501 domain-containing protein [Brachybacterium sp. EF45031]|uniref:DUF501 domain-containing protein n=1 Tax=Brachybacterium sillae TaxID=2810536 RepID=UPI00217D176C|nr:DUF501 domain-containing protein [Brachybacterium sillae]MCS6712666.1 DUF501 domain-containing protein [Brachybacterium sillae]